jgi:glutaredoxin-related protein
MKLLLSAFLLSVSASSFASCLVELSGTSTNPFIENSCRDALRECNRYKRSSNIQYGSCSIVDRNYRGGGSYGGGNQGGGSYGGGTNYPQTNNRIIQDFINGASRNCTVTPYVNGEFHQVYVSGQFRGNYDIRFNSQLKELKRVLNNYVRNGSCQLNRVGGVRTQYDPAQEALQDLMNGQYVNCYIKANVNGQYDQVYVNGQFRGNYDTSISSERFKLKEVALNLQRSGVCYR